MKQSQLFTKTRKDAPADEVSKNAQLLIRAGFIHKEMAGVYDLLPLGLRVYNKIVNIIREEMNALGGQELHMTALQNPEVWEKTDRWDDDKVDSWFKTELRSGGRTGLGFTHEEPVTKMIAQQISSWRDLPTSVYQFQTKFRNEERAKSGLMRTREFVMKDLYSFAKDAEEHKTFYDRASQAYVNIFNRFGLGSRTYKTYASGGSFSEYSHEFQTVCEAGEDIIYIHTDDLGKGLAMHPAHATINKEIYTDEVKRDLGLGDNFVEMRAVEVGNIFTLGTRFSEALGLRYRNEAGVGAPVFMGSYGIGPARSIAVIVETLSDAKGMVWPESVAPFQIHLVELSQGNEKIKKIADDLYADLMKAGVEVLYDDRDARAGEKFADSDLIGIPYRVVIGKSTTPDSIEIVRRSDSNVTQVSRDAILKGSYHASQPA
jgi:prolyl-tRNA synthetase